MTEHSSTHIPHVPMREFTILMALLISIVAISIDALLPALGMISKDLQMSHPNQAQYVIVFLFVGMAIGQLVCGPASDAMGRKKVLYLGIALYLAGSLLCFFANSLDMILAGRFIQGLGVSGPYVSAVSIVRDKYSGRDMARVMSLIMMIFIMVPAIAPSLGQAILFFASWRYIFLLYIIYSIIISLWLFFRLEETLPVERRIPFSMANIVSGFKDVVGNRATVSYTICMGICFGSFIGYLNSSQQIFQTQFDTGKLFTVYFGCLALVLGVASLVNARLVVKLGMRYICIRSILCIIISSLIFLGVNLLMDVHLWMFLLYAGILFFSLGLMFGNLNSLAMEPMGDIAGIASAIIGSASSVMSMCLGALIGQLYNNTLIPLISGFLILGIFSFLIMLYAEKPAANYSD